MRVAVALREGAELTPEQLVDYCVSRMPDFMVPRYVEFLPELPHTPTGRVEKYRLRETPLGEDAYDRGDPREARFAGGRS